MMLSIVCSAIRSCESCFLLSERPTKAHIKVFNVKYSESYVAFKRYKHSEAVNMFMLIVITLGNKHFHFKLRDTAL